MGAMLAIAAVGCVLVTAPAAPRLRFACWLGLYMTLAVTFWTTSGLRDQVSLSATYAVIATIGAAALATRHKELLPQSFFPLLLFLAVAWSVWPGGAEQNGTTLNLLLGIAAWPVGAYLGSLYMQFPAAERILLVIVGLAMGFEVVVCLLQTTGVDIFASTGRAFELEGDRPNGTFSHPSVLGKVASLLLVLVLPSTRSTRPGTRRLAYGVIVLSILATGLTVSRANAVGIAAMVVVWSFVQFRQTLLRRLAPVGAIALVGLFFLDQLLERFAADPEGGARAHFNQVALEQFSRTPWLGVGPGRYVEEAGRFDALTADGWIVHNIFLLQLTELGIIGATLFFLPLVLLFVQALRSLRREGRPGAFSAAVIAYAVALLPIGMTGWGLMSPGNFALLVFVMGFCHIQLRAHPAGEPDEQPRTGLPRSTARGRVTTPAR